METPNGNEGEWTKEQWKEVDDFASTGASDRCYTLDGLDGTITFGPSLLQPNGSISHFGALATFYSGGLTPLKIAT